MVPGSPGMQDEARLQQAAPWWVNRRGFPSGTWWLQGPNKNHRIKLSKATFLVDDVNFFVVYLQSFSNW
jgi:hypothetical protein